MNWYVSVNPIIVLTLFNHEIDFSVRLTTQSKFVKPQVWFKAYPNEKVAGVCLLPLLQVVAGAHIQRVCKKENENA